MRLAIFFFALVLINQAFASKCANLGSSIDLGKLFPAVTKGDVIDGYMTSKSTPFPTVRLTKVTFEDSPALATLQKEIPPTEGTFDLEISPIQWVGGETLRFSQYQIGLRVLKAGTRDFVGIPRTVMETPEGLAAVYGDVSVANEREVLFEGEYSLGSYVAYGTKVKLQDGRITNIEFKFPKTIQKKSRYTKYADHEVLCVKSYEKAYVDKSE